MPLGEAARLYCEAFVGKVKLPDARNFISWYQIFDDQENPVDGLQEIITRYAPTTFYKYNVKCKTQFTYTNSIRFISMQEILANEIQNFNLFYFLFYDLQGGRSNCRSAAHIQGNQIPSLRSIFVSH